LLHWSRIGLATFRPYKGIAFNDVDDKDASMFPTLIPEPSGRHAIALLHRPLFPGTRPEEKLCKAGSEPIDIDRESIWISYCHSVSKGDEDHHLEFVAHHRLACPVEEWERLKIGGGAPPVFCRDGWLMLYHGVHDIPQMNTGETALCYSAGAMVLSKENPNKIIYRSPHPVLVPKGLLEREGVVANVVFRSGIDRRDDLGAPERFDVYYGMADYRIGVARLDVPATLPQGAAAERHSL
jgi:beta-1,2-mannobiose phosphorylase / 1,2-beta-oligomannan phosphorylase